MREYVISPYFFQLHSSFASDIYDTKAWIPVQLGFPPTCCGGFGGIIFHVFYARGKLTAQALCAFFASVDL